MSTFTPGNTSGKPGQPFATPKKAVSSDAGISRRAGRLSTKDGRQARVSESEIVGWIGGQDCILPPAKAVASQSAVPSKSAIRSGSVLSDEEIGRQARERVNERNHPGFQTIELEVQNRIIIVRGTVRSKGERVLLLHVLKQTPGADKVIDCLSSVRPTVERKPIRLPEFNLGLSLPTTLSLPSIPFKNSHIAAVLAGVVSLSLVVWFTTGRPPVAVHRVTGRVVLEGTALPQASVVLHPVGKTKLPKGVTPRATAKDDGGFAVATFSDADGAPEGEFIATVHLLKPVVVDGDTIPGPNVLPEVYSRPETSPFRVNIRRDTKELAVLELHKTQTR